VIVQDTTAPVIKLNGLSPSVVEAGTVYSDQFATMTDNVDVTNVALVGISTVNSAVPGTYTVTYNYTDSSGNVALPVVRQVIVQDTTAPVIKLNGLSPSVVEAGTVYSDQFATMTDNVDVTNVALVGVSTVNSAVPGTYTVTYNYTDSSGNVASPVVRQVIVQDTTAPVIKLNGMAAMNVVQNKVFNDLGAIVTDNVDIGLVARVSGTVNTAVAGTYSLTYRVTDAAGNVAIPVVRTVTVTAPVVATPATLSLSDAYAVPGGTAIVPIKIGPNVGVLSFNISVSYDSTQLTLGAVDTTALPASWACTLTNSPPNPSGMASVQATCSSAVAADAITAPSTILKLPMTVNAASALGTVSALSLTGSQLFDATNTPVQATLTGGNVIVSSVSTSYNLNAGWNLISFPLDLGVTGLQDFLASSPMVTEVWSYTNGQWQSNIVGLPAFLNSLTAVQAGTGYWVKSNSVGVVTLTGTGVVALAVPSYQLGWHLVGTIQPVVDIPAYMNTQGASEVWGYSNGSWCSSILGLPAFLNCLQTMQPQNGYFIKTP